MAPNPADFLRPGECTVFSIGAYLGPEITRHDRHVANRRARVMMQHLRLLPTRDDHIQCPTCGNLMTPSEEPTRKLGFRFCSLKLFSLPLVLHVDRSQSTIIIASFFDNSVA